MFKNRRFTPFPLAKVTISLAAKVGKSSYKGSFQFSQMGKTAIYAGKLGW
jgi:hypothetical protein